MPLCPHQSVRLSMITGTFRPHLHSNKTLPSSGSSGMRFISSHYRLTSTADFLKMLCKLKTYCGYFITKTAFCQEKCEIFCILIYFVQFYFDNKKNLKHDNKIFVIFQQQPLPQREHFLEAALLQHSFLRALIQNISRKSR